jgi:hypothetical protein
MRSEFFLILIPCFKFNALEIWSGGKPITCQMAPVDHQDCMSSIDIKQANLTYMGTKNFEGQKAKVWGYSPSSMADVKLFINLDETAVLGLKVDVEASSPDDDEEGEIKVVFTQWSNTASAESNFKVPTNCRQSSLKFGRAGSLPFTSLGKKL